MANSRFDNIRYYSDGEFKIPQEIKVYDGNEFISLGAKNSFNTKKLCAFDGSNMFCATYYRNDVDIPGTEEIGKNKYLSIQKANGTACNVDTYHSGYEFDMTVEVNQTTPLYTVFCKNKGDITNQSYTNYIAKVDENNKVALYIYTIYNGISINSGKLVNVSTKYTTTYCLNANEKVRILLTRASDSGKLRIRLYDKDGNNVFDQTPISDETLWVGTPNHHYLGVETTSKTGATSTYGKAKISYFKFTPERTRSNTFEVNMANQPNGATVINSTGTFSGKVASNGTSVYASSYTEYIRQTI